LDPPANNGLLVCALQHVNLSTLLLLLLLLMMKNHRVLLPVCPPANNGLLVCTLQRCLHVCELLLLRSRLGWPNALKGNVLHMPHWTMQSATHSIVR
jgi:hypothetical protein